MDTIASPHSCTEANLSFEGTHRERQARGPLYFFKQATNEQGNCQNRLILLLNTWIMSANSVEDRYRSIRGNPGRWFYRIQRLPITQSERILTKVSKLWPKTLPWIKQILIWLSWSASIRCTHRVRPNQEKEITANDGIHNDKRADRRLRYKWLQTANVR